MRISSFKNFIGNDSYIYINETDIVKSNICDIINIFCTKYLLVSVIALDCECEFFQKISKIENEFIIISQSLPQITSKTQILTELQYLLPFWEKLLGSDPKCITIYGLGDMNYTDIEKSVEIFHKVKDNRLINNGIINFVLDIILEENIVRLSFNKKTFDFKEVLRKMNNIKNS